MSGAASGCCRCCGLDGGRLDPQQHCAPCARGQHTQKCDPAQKAAIAAKAGKPAAAAASRPSGPAKPAPPAAPSAQATPEPAAPAPTPPEPIAPPAPAQDAEPVPVQSLRAEPTPAQALVTAPAETRGVARTIAAGDTGLALRSFEDFWRFAKAVASSGIVKGYETPEKALVALQFGAEVGLSPMQSLQNVATINGRPALHSDAPLAIVRASGLLEDFDEWYEHDGQRLDRWPTDPKPETAAFCLVTRKGERELVRSFSKGEAVTAGLWSKDGPWKTYPGRMMRMRARAFALRDAFPDKLKGMRTVDEVADYIDVTPPSTEVPLPRRASETKAAEAGS